MKRDDIGELIIATDAGREGELVARWIMWLAGWGKRPFKRLWISSQTDEAILNGFENLKNGINLSREFIWRNSGCKLNLNISYLVIDEYKKKSFFPSDGLLKPEYIEPDLFANGITRNQYGIVIAIYAPPAGGGNYGGMKILGQSGYSFFRYPCRTSVIYPGKKSDINYKATWLFTHEIQHSIDLICYEGSNAPEMWHGDKPLDYSINAGEQFDYQAEIFRNFKNYLKSLA